MAKSSKRKIVPPTRRAKQLEQQERQAKIETIIQNYAQYNPDAKKIADFQRKFQEALSFSKRFAAERKDATSLNDRFSEPLYIVEQLVTLEQADCDTIIAAVLYPHLIPVGRNAINHERMLEVKAKFGPRVKTYVEDTISLWSPSRLPTEAQKQNENSRDFTLMALLLARSRAAVMIRATQALVTIKQLDRNQNRAAQEEVLARATLIADLAYLAKCSNLRNHMLNQKLRFSDYTTYKTLKEHIQTARILGADNKPRKEKNNDQPDRPDQDVRVKVSEKEIDLAIQKALKGLRKSHFGGHFQTLVRHKEIFSLEQKTGRKGQAPDKIGDVIGVCIVIDNDYIDTRYPNIHSQQNGILHQAEAEVAGNRSLVDPEHRAVLEAYKIVTSEHGRDSKNPVIQNLFEELKTRDPDETDPTKDARHDDYYQNEKPSGYRAKQDTIFITLDNVIYEIEIQFVSKKQKDFNDYGDPENPDRDPSHVFYKTGMGNKKREIKAWRANAEATDENGNRARVPFTALYWKDNRIITVEGSKPGMDPDNPTGGVLGTDFIRDNLALIRETYPEMSALMPNDEEFKSQIRGMVLDNDNPTVPRSSELVVIPETPLRSGDRIEKIVFSKEAMLKSQRAGPG